MNLPADERLAGLLSEGDTCLASDAVDEDSLALCRGRNIAMLSSPGVAEGKAFPLPAQARDSCFRHFLLACRAPRPRLAVCFCTDALVLQYVFIHLNIALFLTFFLFLIIYHCVNRLKEIITRGIKENHIYITHSDINIALWIDKFSAQNGTRATFSLLQL